MSTHKLHVLYNGLAFPRTYSKCPLSKGCVLGNQLTSVYVVTRLAIANFYYTAGINFIQFAYEL